MEHRHLKPQVVTMQATAQPIRIQKKNQNPLKEKVVMTHAKHQHEQKKKKTKKIKEITFSFFQSSQKSITTRSRRKRPRRSSNIFTVHHTTNNQPRPTTN